MRKNTAHIIFWATCLTSSHSLSASLCGYVNGEAIINELSGRSCADAMAAARAGAQRSYSNDSYSEGTSSSSYSSGAAAQAAQQGAAVIEQLLQEEQSRNEQLLEELRRENEKIQFERQQQKQRINASQQDNSLNPWANNSMPKFKPGSGAGNAAGNPAAAAAPKPPRDPNANYEGQSCEYFTRPSDEAHLNYHREGATVSYGGRIYKCVNARWKFITTTDRSWASPKATADMEASIRENSK